MSQDKRQTLRASFAKAMALIIVGALAFWAATVAISVLPIAAQYRAAYTNWSIQAVWIGALPAGLIVAGGVTYALVRLRRRFPAGSPVVYSSRLALVALLVATVLIDVPRTFLPPVPSEAPRYFLIGVLLNLPRFLALGLVIGAMYRKQSASADLVMASRGGSR